MDSAAPVALACRAAQSAAACAGVRFAWDMKFGSLNPSKNFDPVGMAPLTVLAPHTIGTNSMPVLPPEGCRLQLYHQLTAGENAAPGAVFVAIPRLRNAGAPAAPPLPAAPAPPVAAPPVPAPPVPAPPVPAPPVPAPPVPAMPAPAPPAPVVAAAPIAPPLAPDEAPAPPPTPPLPQPISATRARERKAATTARFVARGVGLTASLYSRGRRPERSADRGTALDHGRSLTAWAGRLLDATVRRDRHRRLVLVVPPTGLHPAGLKVAHLIGDLELAERRETGALVARHLVRLLGGVAGGQRRLLEQSRDHVQLLLHREVGGQAIGRSRRIGPGDAGRAKLAAISTERLFARAGEIVVIAGDEADRAFDGAVATAAEPVPEREDHQHGGGDAEPSGPPRGRRAGTSRSGRVGHGGILRDEGVSLEMGCDDAANHRPGPLSRATRARWPWEPRSPIAGRSTTSPLQNHHLQLREPRRLADDLHLDDLPARSFEDERHARHTAGGPDGSCGAVDEGGLRGLRAPGEDARHGCGAADLFSQLRRAVGRSRRGRAHRRRVDPQHDVRIEDGDERVEPAVPRSRQKGVDDLTVGRGAGGRVGVDVGVGAAHAPPRAAGELAGGRRRAG